MSESFRSVRPKKDEHIDYYSTYIDKVPDGDIVDLLTRQTSELVGFLRSIPEEKHDHAYAPGKWTVRQIAGHLSDGERVFQYRAFRFSRADDTPVPGFDENLYVDNAPFSNVSMPDLIAEFEDLRRASIHLFSNMSEEAMSRRGVANEAEISVRAIAFILVGHVIHHMGVIRSKYLNES
jgi:hypothetical protein